MTVTPQELRNTLRYWASGVSIVTTLNNGALAGMTVSSFSSLSLEPPSIVVCLQKDTYTAQMVKEAGVFGVSILAADNVALSDRFAGRVKLDQHADRFNGVALNSELSKTGSPLIADALGWMDCRVQFMHDGNSHWIVVGEVVAAGENTASSGAPLVYYDRAYRDIK